MKRVIIVAFSGAQTLDIAGPAEVFSTANHAASRLLYRVVLAASRVSLRSAAGLSLQATPLKTLRPRRSDTIIVVGGDSEPLVKALQDDALLSWIQAAARAEARVSSVCTGAFLLAQAGVLDHKRATTHWFSCEALANFRPQVTVEREAIFVRHDRTWTSAGVTTGIDMALAMVEDDHGKQITSEIAARLVLYLRRSGSQAQLSTPLLAQRSDANPLDAVIDWARQHLSQLNTAQLSHRAGLTPRTFHRRCLQHHQITPAKLIERLRVEQANALRETTSKDAKQIALLCGFTNATQMARALKRWGK